jgi:hypothetical protein
VVSRNGCDLPARLPLPRLLHRRKEVLINMGFHVRFGIGPLRYSAPLTRRRRRTRKEQEADGTIKVILFLIFVVLVVGNLIVKAAIAHPAAALFIGCAVAGGILLGVIGVRERRRINARAARCERDALASVQSGSADSAVITNDASSERLINQSAGREVTPADVPPLPAKRAESDLVAVAEAQVAEKWRELEQLDARRIETGVDLESEMQRVFQEGLDITTEIFWEHKRSSHFRGKSWWSTGAHRKPGSSSRQNRHGGDGGGGRQQPEVRHF